MPWYAVLGIVSAALGIGGAILKSVQYMNKIIVHAVVEALRKEIVEVKTVALETKGELNTNGGKSFADSLNRRFHDIDEHLNRQDTRIDRLFVVVGNPQQKGDNHA